MSLVIFDIGSGSVGAAAVKLPPGRAPHFEYVKRLPLPIKSRVQSETLAARTIAAVKEIAAHFLKEKRHADEVAFSLTSPWHSAHTKIISLKEKVPFTITPELIEKIVERETTLAEKEAGNDMAVIEKRIANAKINGYSTADPYGKTTDNIELSLYISLAPREFLNKIEESVSESFSVKQFSHHSFPLISFGTIRQLFQNERHFIFVDIASEITDMITVEGSAITSTTSFPIGKNHLVRKIADRFNIDPELAFSFLKLASTGRAEKYLAGQIAVLTTAVKEEWQTYFNQILADIYGTRHLPHKIFLTADDDVGELFLSFIPPAFFSKVFLGGDALRDFYTTGEHLPHDPFLALQGIYLNSILM